MPPSEPIADQPGFREALREHERAVRVNTGRVAAAVVRWSVRESIIASVSFVAMYSLACYSKTSFRNAGIVFNNFYFLSLAAIIVVTGNYFFNRLRFREFALRFELDKNKQILQEANE